MAKAVAAGIRNAGVGARVFSADRVRPLVKANPSRKERRAVGVLSWLFGYPPEPRRRRRRRGTRRAIREEQQRLAREKREEQQRVAREKREERERVARERTQRAAQIEREVHQQMDESYRRGHLVANNPELTASRRSLPPSAFALPSERALPIHDARHLRSSLGRFSQQQFRSLAEARDAVRRIVEAAQRHGVPIREDTIVAQVAGVYAERVAGHRGR